MLKWLGVHADDIGTYKAGDKTDSLITAIAQALDSMKPKPLVQEIAEQFEESLKTSRVENLSEREWESQPAQVIEMTSEELARPEGTTANEWYWYVKGWHAASAASLDKCVQLPPRAEFMTLAAGQTFSEPLEWADWAFVTMLSRIKLAPAKKENEG